MADPTTDVSSRPSFHIFPLDKRILAAIETLGFEEPTPIQEQAMPPLFEGHDVIGRARTGSGKTAAFGLPLLERLKDAGNGARALVLAPTRELALQVTEAMRSYATQLQVRMVTVYGGAPYGPQIRALKAGAQVVVGTPGRILDHLDRKTLDLSEVDFVVVDEADEMLQMGFIEDVEKILSATHATRQVALFSATMPPPIRKIADKHLQKPLEVMVEEDALSVDHIRQGWMRVPHAHKLEALKRVLAGKTRGTTLVFTQTRVSCAEVADALAKSGLAADALHGDLQQAGRERVLQRMRARRLEVVIATDVAARGLDVEHITHVINLDLPRNTETYVHRIGRTGRAGRNGMAISFVTPSEMRRVHTLERRLKVEIEELQVPSDATIAVSQRDDLFEDLEKASGEEEYTTSKALTDLLAKTGWSAEQAADAALTLLAEGRGLTLDTSENGKLDDQPPWWSRPSARERRGRNDRYEHNDRAPRDNQFDDRPRGPKRDFGRGNDAADAVQIFVPIGKRQGLRPADVVGAFANEANISGRAIGQITIFDRKAFVGVTEEVASRLLGGNATVSLRGHDVKVSRSWSQPPAGKERPFGGQPRSQRPGKRERERVARRRPDQQHPGGGRKGS